MSVRVGYLRAGARLFFDQYPGCRPDKCRAVAPLVCILRLSTFAVFRVRNNPYLYFAHIRFHQPAQIRTSGGGDVHRTTSNRRRFSRATKQRHAVASMSLEHLTGIPSCDDPQGEIRHEVEQQYAQLEHVFFVIVALARTPYASERCQ